MRLTRLLFVITILLAALACTTDNPLSSPDTSAITLSINLPRGERIPDTGTGLAKAMVIASVTVTVTADDMEDIEESLDVSEETASGTLKVPRGEDRTFTVECRDGNDIPQYSGSTTQDILQKSETVEITTEGHYPAASTLSITSFDAASVTLSWTENTDLDFASYELVRAGNAEDLTSSSIRESITTIIDQNTTDYTDDSVSPNTRYYYAIIVWDTEGMGMRSSPPVSVQTPQYFSASGPWAIPDNGWMYYYFYDNSFAPSGATVTNVEYGLKIDDTGDDDYFFCQDYEIYISTSTSAGAVPDALVYDHLGGWTDGDYDDDTDDDSDIYLNWRSTDYFNGEAANQYWGVYIIDNWSGDSGELDYIEFRIYYVTPYYVTPLGKPGVITMTVPANAADEGPSPNGSHPTGAAQGSIDPVSTGFDKIKSPAGP